MTTKSTWHELVGQEPRLRRVEEMAVRMWEEVNPYTYIDGDYHTLRHQLLELVGLGAAVESLRSHDAWDVAVDYVRKRLESGPARDNKTERLG